MTERDQCAFEEALRSDLAAARQQVMVLTDQLRDANALNEALSYKVDILVKQVAALDASKGQFERVSIRVATLAESVATVAIKQLEEIRDEIRLAAFAKVPGMIPSSPAEPTDATASNISDPVPSVDDLEAEIVGKLFGAGFEGSASKLPPARFGNGAAK